MSFPGPLLQNTHVSFGFFNQRQTGWDPTTSNGPDLSWLNSWLPNFRFLFPEFDENNPRAWIRRCENFFQLYQILGEAKMHCVAIHLKDHVDNWIDSYMLDYGGKVSWDLFCWNVCLRFGNTMPINIVREFNRLDQLKDVKTYQPRFEELHCLMVNINPALHD